MRTLILLLTIISLSAVETEVTVDLSQVQLPDRVTNARAELDTELAEAATAYAALVEKLKADAIADMEKARKRERDALVGLAIQAQIDQIHTISVADETGDFMAVVGTDIVGNYVQGDLNFTVANRGGNLHLSNVVGHHSVGHVHVGNKHIFKWSDHNSAMVVVKNNDNTVTISCYPRFFQRVELSEEVTFEGNKPAWSFTASASR